MNTAEISFIVILGVMAAFYFIFIRPARQEQKRVESTIRDLAVGDEVITTAGFFATIKQIETPEEGPVQIVLDFGNGVEIRALTSSIMRRLSRAEEPAEAVEKAGGA
jgi:preprotein translocase subunit YajC